MTDRSDFDRPTAYDQRLARLVARPLARAGISPNAITFAGLLIGLYAASLFARGDAVLTSWGGALFILAAWIDHLDGEVARAAGKTSRFGHYFDHVAAMTTYISMFVGMGLGLGAGALGGAAMALAAAAGLSVAAIFTLRMWIETRLGSEAVALTPVAGFEVEDTLYVVGPVAWLGLTEAFLLAAGIGTPLFLLWVVRDAVRAARARSA